MDHSFKTFADSPFPLAHESAYRAWRDWKCEVYPRQPSQLVVSVADPRALSRAEQEAMLACCRVANMVIYDSPQKTDDKTLAHRLGAQFGLLGADTNWLADDDGISRLEVAMPGERMRPDYIPYTNKPIRWHTDGYYNPPARRIWAMVLHCVRPAQLGGENAVLDHEMAYLLLRDENPAHIAALLEPDAMTIPAREDEHGIARPAEVGPVFHIDPQSGALHMRYTARTRSILWKDKPETRAAVAALERILAESPWVLRLRMSAGMGLLCNNVLHDRSGFSDDPAAPRLLYRARYSQRIASLPRE